MSELTRAVANDPSLLQDINLVGQSPHVFAYRMWFQRPEDADWTEFGSGDTEDDIPDHQATGPHPGGTRVVINVAVGGKPGSTFRFLVTFSQAGEVAQGGAFLETGRTGANGGGGRKISVVFL